MPENTEVLSKNEEQVEKNDSGTESDSDDSIPELEDTAIEDAGQTQGVNPLTAAAGLNEDMVSRAKQSRGEKKARKILSKLGLKQVETITASLYRIVFNLPKHQVSRMVFGHLTS